MSKIDAAVADEIIEVYFETEDCDTNYWCVDNRIGRMYVIADRDSHNCALYEYATDAVVEHIIPEIASWWTTTDIRDTFTQEQINFMASRAETLEAVEVFSCASDKPAHKAQTNIPAVEFDMLERLYAQSEPMTRDDFQAIEASCEVSHCIHITDNGLIEVCIPSSFDNGKHMNLLVRREEGFEGGGHIGDIEFGDADQEYHRRSEWRFVGRVSPDTIAGTYCIVYDDEVYMADVCRA